MDYTAYHSQGVSMDFEMLFGIAFELLIILGLVLMAKKRTGKCHWDRRTVNRRFWFGIVGIIAVQIGGLLALTATGQGIGITAAVQWPCIYWVALATYRKRDLLNQGISPRG
jgi:hypothetical protein